MNRTWRVFVFIITLLYSALIFYLSSLENVGMQGLSPFSVPQLLQHGAEFALLGLLVFVLLRSDQLSGWKLALSSILIAGFYGVTDEIHQYFVPGRVCSIEDVIADFLGATFAVLIMLSFQKMLASKPRIES